MKWCVLDEKRLSARLQRKFIELTRIKAESLKKTSTKKYNKRKNKMIMACHFFKIMYPHQEPITDLTRAYAGMYSLADRVPKSINARILQERLVLLRTIFEE